MIFIKKLKKIQIKRQSEHSGLRPETSSLVYVEIEIWWAIQLWLG